MTFEELKTRLTTEGFKDKTLLGVQALSKVIVDATIEIANVLKIPMQIGSSYDEIDCESHSGGYVNDWTTESFARYVKQADKHGQIFLARTNVKTEGLNKLDLRRLLSSLTADIAAGFDLIHFNCQTIDELRYLINHCDKQDNSEYVVYEVNPIGPIDEFLSQCAGISPKIKFLAGDTGTRIIETRNEGYSGHKARELSNECITHGLLLREHNVDYAADLALKDHLVNGVRAANISVELAVAETTSFIDFLSRGKHKKELKLFYDTAFKSKEWERWIAKETALTKQQKSILCGHYVFSDPTVRSIRVTLNREVYFEDVTRADIGTHLLKYLRYFGWLH